MANCWKNLNLNELNYNEICRLCLSHGGIMSSIFSSPGGVKSVSLPSRIMAFASIKMETGDGLPGLICHSCLFTVERVYEFKLQCEQSDSFLRKYLSSNKDEALVIKKEIEEANEECDDGNGNTTEEDKQNTVHHVPAEDCVDNSKLNCRNSFSNSKELNALLKIKTEVQDNEGDVENDPANEEGDNVESIVMVVDPNAQVMDENFSENDEEDENSDVDSENKIDNMNEYSGGHHWLEGVSNEQSSGDTSSMHHCPSCNKPFNDLQLLERHTMIHTQEPPFPCDYCNEYFNDRAGLKSHWRDHAGPRRLSCMACGEAFPDRTSLAQHVTIHDEVKPFHCNICNKAFTYRSDLRKHSVIHTGARPYVCNICNKSFTRSTNLNKHARAHAGNRPFACSKCSKMFSSRADLARHAVIHTGEKPYACGVCGLAFNRKDKLTRHVKLHTEDRPHACIECPTSFHRKEELTKHVQFHHFKPDPEFISEVITDFDSKDVAENVSTTEIMNEDNVEQAVTEGDTENVVISVDPFQLNNGGEQIQYEHRAQLLFSCGICHKRFSDKTYLRKHRLIHTELKPHVCNICQKAFYRRRELSRHEAVHTGYKPFSCNICQKPFARRDKLARHEKTHKFVKPFQCSKCNETFNNLNNLMQHEIAHNLTISNLNTITINYSTKAYKCFLCTASYARNENLIKHMKSHKVTQQNSNKHKINSDKLLTNPVDYLSKMNPELNVTIKSSTKKHVPS